MNILVISNYYPPHFDGGYELSIAENMQHLQKRGHQVLVLCGFMGYATPSQAIDFSQNPIQRVLGYMEDWHKPNAKIINRRLKATNFKYCTNIFNKVKPDIIYLGNQKKLTIGCALAAQKSGIPLIYDMGDDWLRLYTPHTLRKRISAFIDLGTPLYMRGKLKLNPVITPSQWFAKELVRRYQVERSYVIPRLVQAPPPNARPTSLPLRFLFAGRIEPLKGLHLFIDIAPLLLQTDPQFCLDIYGDDSEHYAIKLKDEVTKLGLNNHFRFKGKCENLMAILPTYDVLLMPTLAQETFGRIIIEAMAARVIVVSSSGYGPSEIISSPQDSLLFDRKNQQSLLDAILYLYRLKPAEIDALKNRAYQKVTEQYSPAEHIPHLEAILTQEIKKQNAKIRGSK